LRFRLGADDGRCAGGRCGYTQFSYESAAIGGRFHYFRNNAFCQVFSPESFGLSIE
jgi:hypothetical protein